MKAEVTVRVSRDAALEAIRTMDALGEALAEHDAGWAKKLRRRYRQTRRDLVRSIGFTAVTSGVAEFAVFD